MIAEAELVLRLDVLDHGLHARVSEQVGHEDASVLTFLSSGVLAEVKHDLDLGLANDGINAAHRLDHRKRQLQTDLVRASGALGQTHVRLQLFLPPRNRGRTVEQLSAATVGRLRGEVVLDRSRRTVIDGDSADCGHFKILD